MSASLPSVRFPASALGVWTRPRAGGHSIPSTAAEALAATGALACGDGPMFGLCDNPPGSTDAARYAASQCAFSHYGLYDASRGIDVSSRYPTEGMTIGSMGEASFVLDGYAKPDGAGVAIQLYPPLVRSGRVVASNIGSNATAEWRAGLASMNDGQLALFVGAMSMQAFAQAILDAGAVDAGYTDGSYSTRLATQTARYGPMGPNSDRRVASWITVAKPSSLLPVVALGAAGAIGTGIYRWLTGQWPWQ